MMNNSDRDIVRRKLERDGYCRSCGETQIRNDTDVIIIHCYKYDCILCLACAEAVGDTAITITGDLNGTTD